MPMPLSVSLRTKKPTMCGGLIFMPLNIGQNA
jgi:hypothetical protein